MKRATLARDNGKQIEGEKEKERRWFNLFMARAENMQIAEEVQEKCLDV